MALFIICMRAAAHQTTRRSDCLGEHSKKPRQVVQIALDVQAIPLPVMVTVAAAGPFHAHSYTLSKCSALQAQGREGSVIYSQIQLQPLHEGSTEEEARSKAMCMYTQNVTLPISEP